jgi:hypothetical protein
MELTRCASCSNCLAISSAVGLNLSMLYVYRHLVRLAPPVTEPKRARGSLVASSRKTATPEWRGLPSLYLARSLWSSSPRHPQSRHLKR